jgi:hypothetical protein
MGWFPLTVTWAPEPNVIKLFTMVVYHHPMIITSFYVVKLYYRGNFHGMEVNYSGILTLEKEGSKLMWYCFIISAPGANVMEIPQ